MFQYLDEILKLFPVRAFMVLVTTPDAHAVGDFTLFGDGATEAGA